MVNILYRSESEILNGIDINTINFENLIKLASSHLMLPALYFNINKKNCSYLFPDDFIAYIRNIFEIKLETRFYYLKQKSCQNFCLKIILNIFF
jgi:hypothetical protein